MNIHPSLVPHCLGSDSTAWCIREECPAGVSLLEMESLIDTGGVYVQQPVSYDFPSESGGQLHRRLETEAVKLFRRHWPDIYAGRTTPTPQNGLSSYHTRRETNHDRRRMSTDNLGTLEAFMRWVLAHDFAPGTTAEVVHNGAAYRLRLNVERLSEIVPDRS